MSVLMDMQGYTVSVFTDMLVLVMAGHGIRRNSCWSSWTRLSPVPNSRHHGKGLQ